MDMQTDQQPIMNRLEELLGSSQCEEAKALLKEPSFIENAINYPEDFFEIITRNMSPQNQNSNPALVDTCQEMMTTFVEDLSDPEDTHLSLLKFIQSPKNDVLFLAALQCVGSCLQRMKRARALRGALAAIKAALFDHSTLGNVKVDRFFVEIAKFCSSYIDSIREEESTESEKQKQCIATFLLSWLQYYDMPHLALIESMKTLAKVLPHFGVPLEYLNEAEKWRKGAVCHRHLDQVESHCCFGVFYYNAFHHGICLDSLPQVYSPQFLFVRLGALCSKLLTHQKELQEKGVYLLKDVLDRVDPGSIPHTALSSNHYPDLFLGLSDVMLRFEDEKLRAAAAIIFRRLLLVFNDRGRHLVLFHGYHTVKDQSVRGYMVTTTKDLIVEYQQTSNYFIRRLPDLLRLMLTLPKDIRPNLHMNVSTILCKLNFLRYVLTAGQKLENFEEIRSSAEDFLKHVPDALKDSRDNISEMMADADALNRQGQCKTSVEVSGSALSYEEQVNSASLWRVQLETIEHVYNLLMSKLQGFQ